MQPVFDVYANIDRRDLGGVASQVEKIMRETKIPKTTQLMLRGQAETMQTSFYRLGLGLLAAIVLVYLLMAINFQSWVDPFIILSALPGALAGILWMLFVTQTTLNVPSLDGRHHVHRRGHREQHSNGGVRQRRKNGRKRRACGGAFAPVIRGCGRW